MARGREPRTARPAESVLRVGVPDRGPERESPGGAGPGDGGRDRERGSPGRRSLAERQPPCVPSPGQQRRRLRRRASGGRCGPGSTPPKPPASRRPPAPCSSPPRQRAPSRSPSRPAGPGSPRCSGHQPSGHPCSQAGSCANPSKPGGSHTHNPGFGSPASGGAPLSVHTPTLPPVCVGGGRGGWRALTEGLLPECPSTSRSSPAAPSLAPGPQNPEQEPFGIFWYQYPSTHP